MCECRCVSNLRNLAKKAAKINNLHKICQSKITKKNTEHQDKTLKLETDVGDDTAGGLREGPAFCRRPAASQALCSAR